jgi:hypothetical protein
VRRALGDHAVEPTDPLVSGCYSPPTLVISAGYNPRAGRLSAQTVVDADVGADGGRTLPTST